MEQYSPAQIFAKLERLFAGEGLRFKASRLEDGPPPRLTVDLERYAPGLPVNFMVKGLRGTFRRYYHPQTEVILGKYERLPGVGEPFLAKRRPKPSNSIFQGTPGLDLRALREGDLQPTLESFLGLLARQGQTQAWLRLTAEQRPIVEKWAQERQALLLDYPQEERLSFLRLAAHADSAPEYPPLEKAEFIPASLLKASFSGPENP